MTHKTDPIDYNKIYQDPKYGHPPDRPILALEVVRDELPKMTTLLDVSTGRGQFVKLVKDEFSNVHISVSEHSEHLLMTDLVAMPRFKWNLPDPCPLGDIWDMVTCFDVMEHLEEDVIDESIKQLGAVTRIYLAMSIALYSAPFNGVELHKTIRNSDWWLEKLKQNLSDHFWLSKVFVEEKTLWVMCERVL